MTVTGTATATGTGTVTGTATATGTEPISILFDIDIHRYSPILLVR